MSDRRCYVTELERKVSRQKRRIKELKKERDEYWDYCLEYHAQIMDLRQDRPVEKQNATDWQEMVNRQETYLQLKENLIADREGTNMSRTVSAEVWNGPDLRVGQRVTWNAPVCDDCWAQEYGYREPVRVRQPNEEVCALCGTPNRSGIYLRMAPDQQVFKAWEWLEP
jgi:hypothetical protein